MGYNPKRNLDSEIQPRKTMQWNLHYPVDHEQFSHLLTSIN